MRALVGALCLFLLERQLPSKSWFWKLVILGTLDIGLFFISALRLPGGVAAIFQALGPLCVLLLAWLILHARPKVMQYISVIVGVIGVSLVVLRGDASIDWIGVAAAIGCTVSLSLGSVLMNKWGAPELSFKSFTAWQLLIGGIELGIFTLIIGDLPESITFTNIIGFIILGVLLTAVPFLLWFQAISTAGATTVIPFILLTPVTAFILDAFFKHHMPTILQIIGVIIVLAALLINQRGATAKK